MKKLILVLLILAPVALVAQDQAFGNLTVFSDKGEQFFLYLNGEKKNDKPMSKVRVEQLTALSYNVKIEYNDASHFTITRNNVFISDGDDILMDAAYRIVRNGSSGKLKFYSMNPVKKGVVPFTPGDDNTSSTQNSEYTTGVLNVFSEQGEPFFLYLNGEKQNEKPYANVRVEGLSALAYNVKIVYSDPKLNPVTRNKVYISDGDDNMMDATYKVSRTSWYGKLKFYSMNPLNTAFVAPAGMYVHHYGNSAADYAGGTVKDNSKVNAENKNAVATKPALVNEPVKPVATQKKNTDVKKNPDTKKDPVVAKPVQATVKTAKEPEKKEPAPKTPANNATVVKEPEGWLCQNEWPMWKTEYADAKKNIMATQGDKQKLAAAMKLAGKNCLSCDQVAEIGSLLTEESSKLEFAKFAFSHTIDIKNYLKITRIFTTEKSKEQLTKFVASM